MAWSKEKTRKYQRDYREKHKARYQAKNKIKRQVCEVDGCGILGERHHDDYSKPLDVRFMCKEHHGR